MQFSQNNGGIITLYIIHSGFGQIRNYCANCSQNTLLLGDLSWERTEKYLLPNCAYCARLGVSTFH
eukprot:COSAG02_NODE_2360_length_9063_cov_19.715529_10_plen_66_part_00